MAIRTGVFAIPLAVWLAVPATAWPASAPQASTPQAFNICPPDAAVDSRSQHVARLKLYNQTRMPQADVDALLDVANRIWTPYGVTMALSQDPDAIAVILTNREVLTSAAGAAQVLGTTLFTDGHATPYIRLSRGAAEEFAEHATDGDVRFNVRPRNQRDSMLTSILGVALAHEMAHYLLDTAEHASAGLLQRGLGLRDLVSPEPARLRLTPHQQHLLTAVSGPPARCPVR